MASVGNKEKAGLVFFVRPEFLLGVGGAQGGQATAAATPPSFFHSGCHG